MLLHFQQCKGGAVDINDVMILNIENQAVIQVLIKEVAQHLTEIDDSKESTVRLQTKHEVPHRYVLV